MTALVTNSLRATLIVGIATGTAVAGPELYKFITEDVKKAITTTITGNDDTVEDQIDSSLTKMQLAFTAIDAIKTMDDGVIEDKKSRAMWFTGVGTAGPAITGGAMLLLNKVALAMFIGFGPLFILCLLFDRTKQLFDRWLYYGLGTMFSLAILSVMVSIALKMVIAVASAFWISDMVFGMPHSVNSMALQQGGLGLLLTVLIVSAPPMAAAFFQGTLGQFYAFSQMGGSGGGSAVAASQNQNPYSGGNGLSAAVSREILETKGGQIRDTGFNNPATNPTGSSRATQPDVIKSDSAYRA